MTMKNLTILLFLTLLCTSCRTVFFGDAKVKDGRVGCEEKCAEWGMELVGMVAMGEYTDGCICQKKNEDLSVEEVGKTIIIAGSAVYGGAAVMDQMERDEQKRSGN